MKRFRFTLQALLTVLQQREQGALEVYARALAERQRAVERLHEAQRQCEEAWELGRDRMVAGAPAAHLLQVEQYCREMKELELRCVEVAQQAQRMVDGSLEKLIEARQAREAVEKFRSRQHDHYDHEVRREEQKLLDDLAQRAGVISEALSGESTRWN
jgi:flagellar export protein FliJ